MYASIGSPAWLLDIPPWAQTAALLAAGGFMYLLDGYPFAQILDGGTGTVVTDDYFDDAP